jgi:excisionase family DNA binding protein
MNLADAIRKASTRSAPEEAVVQPWLTVSMPNDAGYGQDPPRQAAAKSAEAPSTELPPREESVEAHDEPKTEDAIEEEPEPKVRNPYFPEPPVVTSGNVVRLELFLNSEQMTGLLKAILSGQHSVLTLKEAAAYLRVSPASIQELAEIGEIPGVLVNGAWRFPKASLDEWMTLSAVRRLGSQLEDVENVA